MKFKIDSLPPGIIVCHIQEPITQAEALLVSKGITRLLSNGKARILMHFSPEALLGTADPVYLEKVLRPQKELARKMGGDIRFAGEGTAVESMPGAFGSLEAAVKSFHIPPETANHAEMQIRKLTEENQRLLEKIEELTEIVRKPSTDAELKAAVEHYRALAVQAENQ